MSRMARWESGREEIVGTTTFVVTTTNAAPAATDGAPVTATTSTTNANAAIPNPPQPAEPASKMNEPQPGASKTEEEGDAPQIKTKGGTTVGAASHKKKFQPTWHLNKEDLPMRRTMITQLVHLLQKRKPHAPPEWLKKIPDMARRLEDSLYRSASSKDMYTNMQTLKQRLHGVAQTYQKQRVTRPAKVGGQSSQSAQQKIHNSSNQRASSMGGKFLFVIL